MKLGHFARLDSFLPQQAGRAAGGNDFDAQFLELAREIGHAGFVGNGNESAFDFHDDFPLHENVGDRIHDKAEGERYADGKGKTRQIEHVRVAGVKRAPHGRDAVGDGIEVNRPENPRVRIGRGKKRAGHEPERNEKDVHDGVKALGRFHRPGDEKPKTGQAKADNEEGAEANQNPLGRDVNADEGREQEKDQSLQKREGGAAENFAADDAAR